MAGVAPERRPKIGDDEITKRLLPHFLEAVKIFDDDGRIIPTSRLEGTVKGHSLVIKRKVEDQQLGTEKVEKEENEQVEKETEQQK